MNRYIAAGELLASYEAQDDNNLDIDVDHLLDSQRRLVEAEIRYYRSRAEYALALKNIHLEKGSLLQYHNLFIFEGPPTALTKTSAGVRNLESADLPTLVSPTVESPTLESPTIDLSSASSRETSFDEQVFHASSQ